MVGIGRCREQIDGDRCIRWRGLQRGGRANRRQIVGAVEGDGDRGVHLVAMAVVQPDRGGDRDGLALTKEVELLVRDIVGPIRPTNVAVAWPNNLREGVLEQRRFCGIKAYHLTGGILVGDVLRKDGRGRDIRGVAIGEHNRATGVVDRRRPGRVGRLGDAAGSDRREDLRCHVAGTGQRDRNGCGRCSAVTIVECDGPRLVDRAAGRHGR